MVSFVLPSRTDFLLMHLSGLCEFLDDVFEGYYQRELARERDEGVARTGRHVELEPRTQRRHRVRQDRDLLRRAVDREARARAGARPRAPGPPRAGSPA